MVEIPVPLKLDDEKAAKIAQSDKWAALSRLASVFAAGVTTLLLLPLIVWGFVTLQQSSITLERHSGDIANVQTTVNAIKAQDGADHDSITILKTQMETVLDQIAKLWQRPAAKSADKAP
jgi:hypothetical protein